MSDRYENSMKARFGPPPEAYAGFWPDEDDFLVAVRTRDSGVLERANFIAAKRRLNEARQRLLKQLDEALMNTIGHQRRARIQDMIERAEDAFIEWRARHWACGWVEYFGLKANAPAPLLDEVERILAELESYPVLDDDLLSEMEMEAVSDYWGSLTEDEREEIAREVGLTGGEIEQARQGEMPSGELFDAIRERVD